MADREYYDENEDLSAVDLPGLIDRAMAWSNLHGTVGSRMRQRIRAEARRRSGGSWQPVGSDAEATVEQRGYEFSFGVGAVTFVDGKVVDAVPYPDGARLCTFRDAAQ